MYLAKDANSRSGAETHYAVKRMHISDRDDLAAIKIEIELMAQLSSCRNIVRFEDELMVQGLFVL